MARNELQDAEIPGKNKGKYGGEKILYYYVVATALVANLVAAVLSVRLMMIHFHSLLAQGIHTLILALLGILFLVLFGLGLPISGQIIMHEWKLTRDNRSEAEQIIGDTKMMLVRGLIMKACIIPIGLVILLLNGSLMAEVSSGIPVFSISDTMYSISSFVRLLVRQFATSFSAFYAIFRLTSCNKIRKGEGIICALLMLVPILDIISLIHLFIVNRRGSEAGQTDMRVDNMLSGTRRPGMMETVSGYIFVSLVVIFAVTGFVLTIALR